MKLKGHISILRVSTNREGQFIEIQVVDETSHARFLEVRVPMVEFAMALTGAGHQPCEFEVRGLEVVGKVREFKMESVPRPEQWPVQNPDRATVALSALAPFERDGWRGQPDDLFNFNRAERHEDNSVTQRVGFTRYVDPETGEPTPND